MNRWDELKEWARKTYKNTEQLKGFNDVITRVMLSDLLKKMKELEDRDYCKSLTEAGY